MKVSQTLEKGESNGLNPTEHFLHSFFVSALMYILDIKTPQKFYKVLDFTEIKFWKSRNKNKELECF